MVTSCDRLAYIIGTNAAIIQKNAYLQVRVESAREKLRRCVPFRFLYMRSVLRFHFA